MSSDPAVINVIDLVATSSINDRSMFERTFSLMNDAPEPESMMML